MGSAIIFEAHDEDGTPVKKIYEVFELPAALIDFLRAMEDCEQATLKWSS